jgi:hypothetical protein
LVVSNPKEWIQKAESRAVRLRAGKDAYSDLQNLACP